MKTGRRRLTGRRRMVGLVLLAGLACGGQCNERRPPGEYLVLTGTVESLRSDTGLLVVRAEAPPQARGTERKVPCLVPSDAEIYVNDRFSSFDAIEIGDTVELIGYQDPNPPGQRFVVVAAHITRNAPPPPEINLTPPTESGDQEQKQPTGETNDG